MKTLEQKKQHALYMRQWYKKNPLGKHPYKKNCPTCQKKILTRKRQQIYCSYICSARNDSIYQLCKVCKKEFLVLHGRAGLKNHKTCSLVCRKILRQSKVGKLAANWQGGKTSLYSQIVTCEKYYKWQKSVFERDGYMCSWCGDNRGGNLEADHIIPKAFIIKEENIQSIGETLQSQWLWDINNGRTLCVDCHKTTATWGSGVIKQIKNNVLILSF